MGTSYSKVTAEQLQELRSFGWGAQEIENLLAIKWYDENRERLGIAEGLPNDIDLGVALAAYKEKAITDYEQADEAPVGHVGGQGGKCWCGELHAAHKAAKPAETKPVKMLPLDELVEKSKREDVSSAQKAVRGKMKELVSAGINDKNGWVYDPGQALANLRRAESASDAILKALRQFDYSDRAKDMTEKLIYFGNARTILEDYIAAAKKSI